MAVSSTHQRRKIVTNDVFSMASGTPYVARLCTEFEVKRLRDEINKGFKRMSRQSRWLRFASAVAELSDSQLNHLTDLDGSNRVAWCAATTADTQEQGIGLARYLRLDDEPDVAEFAVTVIDEFQGQGVGATLLEKLLESARDNGIRVLRGYVLPHNERMLGLCRHLQAQIQEENELFRVELLTTPP